MNLTKKMLSDVELAIVCALILPLLGGCSDKDDLMIGFFQDIRFLDTTQEWPSYTETIEIDSKAQTLNFTIKLIEPDIFRPEDITFYYATQWDELFERWTNSTAIMQTPTTKDFCTIRKFYHNGNLTIQVSLQANNTGENRKMHIHAYGGFYSGHERIGNLDITQTFNE